MDRAPVVAIAGQGATTRLHKESHQILDLVQLFQPITKYSTQIREPQIVPEIVRKAFKVAQTEKPGATFIDFPENIAEMKVDGKPIEVQTAYTSATPDAKIDQAAQIISEAKAPIILAGNGVIRQGAADALVSFAEMLRIPVANTFMAKGVMPFSNRCRSARSASRRATCRGSRSRRRTSSSASATTWSSTTRTCGTPTTTRQIVHIDALPAEVDAHYLVAVGALGDIGSIAARDRGARRKPQRVIAVPGVRKALVEDRARVRQRHGFPVKPQKIVLDLREVLGPDDIAISDVGAHKMWMSRMYRAERPNTCIICNGFAAMGIAVPGAIAAKLAYPDRKVIAVTGDAGFMMNSQEIETGAAHEDAVRDPDLERFGVRPHHLAPASPLRPPEPHRVQESGLREVRRELRRQGLSRRARRGPRADAQAGARRRHRRRSSTARSTTPRT